MKNKSLTLIYAILVSTQIFGEIVKTDFWSLNKTTKEGANYRLEFEDLRETLNVAPQTFKKIISLALKYYYHFNTKFIDSYFFNPYQLCSIITSYGIKSCGIYFHIYPPQINYQPRN